MFFFFNVHGITEQRKTNKDTFNLKDYPDFNAVCKYDEYFVLYRTLSTGQNKTILPFTDDKFNGEILIIKNKNGKIETLTLNKYLKLIKNSIIYKNNSYFSDSDSGSNELEESCDLSGVKC